MQHLIEIYEWLLLAVVVDTFKLNVDTLYILVDTNVFLIQISIYNVSRQFIL